MSIVYTNVRGTTRTLDNLNVVALEYVHSTPEHVRWDYARKEINLSRTSHLDESLRRYIASLRKQIAGTDSSGVERLASIDNDYLVELIENLSRQAEEIVGSYFSDGGGRNESGDGDGTKFDRLMTQVSSALNIIDGLSASNWKGFKAMASAQLLKKNGVRFRPVSGLVDSRQIDAGISVLSQVSKLLQGFQKDEDAASMAKALEAIEKTAAWQLLNELSDNIATRIDTEVTRQLTGIGAKVTTPSHKGSLSAKATIAENGGVSITQTFEKNGQDRYTIRGQLDSNIKWFDEIASEKQEADGQLSGPIQIVQNANYVDWIKRVFGSSVSSMYGVYNTLAFKNQGAAYSFGMVIKSQVLQTSLEMFLAGRGYSAAGIDLGSLVYVNGRAYPMAAIVIAAVKQVQSRPNTFDSSSNDIVYVTTQGDQDLDNQWLGTPGVRNLSWAFARSEKIKGQINRITMRVTVNPIAMIATLNRMNVEPL